MAGDNPVYPIQLSCERRRRADVRLALQTDFAAVLMFLATRSGMTTVNEVAEFYGISAHHVGKVVHQLGRLGYVRNRRGPGGRIVLSRPPGRSPWAG